MGAMTTNLPGRPIDLKAPSRRLSSPDAIYKLRKCFGLNDSFGFFFSDFFSPKLQAALSVFRTDVEFTDFLMLLWTNYLHVEVLRKLPLLFTEVNIYIRK